MDLGRQPYPTIPPQRAAIADNRPKPTTICVAPFTTIIPALMTKIEPLPSILESS
jgi:hypothetical protein